MFKTTVTPQDTHLQISIPKSYVGKEVEIEVKKKTNKTAKPQKKSGIAKYVGALKLNPEQEKSLDEHLKTIRSEWERDF